MDTLSISDKNTISLVDFDDISMSITPYYSTI